MNILLSAATHLELGPTLDKLKAYKKGGLLPYYEYLNHRIDLCETGVGMMHTGYALAEAIRLKKPDLVINIGIVGSYHNDDLGKCYQVISEQQGDLGVSSQDGFQSIFDLKLRDENLYPYKEGKIILNQDYRCSLPKAAGLTLNAISPDTKAAQDYSKRHVADVESMEGAAVAYCCMMSRIPLLMIKSVSNLAGVRDKEQWDISLAINTLANATMSQLSNLKMHETRLL